jgi:hypothetical protein
LVVPQAKNPVVVGQADVVFIGARGFSEESEVVMAKLKPDPFVIVIDALFHGIPPM